MAGDEQSTKDKTARAAGREKRRERQAEKRAKRASQKENGRPARLCSLATVEVRSGNDGFHVSVGGTKGFVIAPDKTNQVLRDLETAILVIRGQL